MRKLYFTPVLILICLTAASCGPARRSEPLIGPIHFSSAEALSGRQGFMRTCNQCHPGGEAGLAPALNNKPLPAFSIRLIVRHGPGAMPFFTREDISDEQLDNVIEYLRVLREAR